jgi:hypothetical protein
MEHAKHLAIYWYSKGHKTKVIAAKMESSFSSKVLPYSTVSYWVRMTKLGSDILAMPGMSAKRVEIGLDDKMFEALNKFPFHSLRMLVSSVKVSCR